jgi:dTDP-4-dehydrorhamnose reductase
VKALITGAGGQLARQCIAIAPAGVELKAVARSECDITDRRAVERLFDSFGPDVVINAAAYTAVDAAEDAPELAYLVNATGAENVARAAELAGARLIQISTDYVFDGSRSTPYTPDAPTNPLNVYGASKLEGETLAIAANASALVIRAGWVYSDYGKNFLVSIMRALTKASPLRVVHDQLGCPTSARELATVIWKAANVEISGVYHWASLGSASWYEFAVEIASLARQFGILEITPPIVGVTTEEYGSRARRPRYSVLDITDLSIRIGETAVAWQSSLAETVKRLARRLPSASEPPGSSGTEC